MITLCLFCSAPSTMPVGVVGPGFCDACRAKGAVAALALSATKPGVVYTVTGLGGVWACTCPARGECKHIRSARSLLTPVPPMGVPGALWPVRGSR